MNELPTYTTLTHVVECDSCPAKEGRISTTTLEDNTGDQIDTECIKFYEELRGKGWWIEDEGTLCPDCGENEELPLTAKIMGKPNVSAPQTSPELQVKAVSRKRGYHFNGLFLAQDCDKELALRETVTNKLLDGDGATEFLVMKEIHVWPLPFKCFFGPNEFRVELSGEC